MKHAGNAFKYLSLLLMLLLFPCQETLAQNGNVKGTVVADDGPVIGATVRVKGQPNAATVTDLDGNFVLKAPKGATLQISYLGYKDKEIKVGNGPIDVTLESDAQALNEVVVVGYGTIRIRGTNSLNATSQPIFVIDGVIIDSDGSDNGNSNPF